MSGRFKDFVLAGILICLLIIAVKPVPEFSFNSQPQTSVPGETVIQLDSNRIAIVETNNNSGLYGDILVFDYGQSKAFKLLGRYNYSDYFRNPQIQKPMMPSNVQ
ncbi:hypothetical protein ACOBQJ_04455 [Pelotomaculum propionicicum]|uniref:hypothetical protein n=1 Tax=Pelotomaculum propionicicum TaxID=258475 RepID=UPI003B7C1128